MNVQANRNKAIVTGAANGIGRAIAQKLAGEGVPVMACDIDAAGLQKLKKKTGSIQTFCLNVADHDAVTNFFKSIEKEQFNWLVNNAGIYEGRNILDYTPADIQRVIQVNNMSAVYFTQFFVKTLIKKKKKGAIVNIASISGQHGSSDAVYGMTKAALVGLTKSTAVTFAPHIRVNAVAPGLVGTGILKRIPKERYATLRKNELLTGAIPPADIAEAVYFLLGNKARNITGITLVINNGQYMR